MLLGKCLRDWAAILCESAFDVVLILLSLWIVLQDIWQIPRCISGIPRLTLLEVSCICRTG